MQAEPVAITGVGIVCALGSSRESVARAARAGTRPFSSVKRFDASAFRVDLAAECPELDIAGRFGLRWQRNTSRTDRLALWAAGDALEQAGFDASAHTDTAVYVGASTGGMAEMEQALQHGGPVPLGTYWSYPVWSTARCIADAMRLGGPQSTYMTACSSAAHALGIAAQRIRRGEHRLAIAGGAESLARLTLSGFGSLGVLDPLGTRPFDAARKGITLGEGAAFFVLEPLAAARQRGARVLAQLAGYGASADARHMVHPQDDGGGAIEAMGRAIEDAGLSISDVDYVNAHGTGTAQNDTMEAVALRTLMSTRQASSALLVSSSKSMLGHTLGAAGALEGALVVLGMQEGFTPPSAGVSEPMGGLDGLSLVREATKTAPSVALSTSFAFGGNNAALVFVHPDRPLRAAVASTPARQVAITSAAVTCPRGFAATPESLIALLDEAAGPGSSPRGLDPGEVLGKRAIRRMDRLSSHVTALVRTVVDAAGLEDQEGTGIGFGTSFGAVDASDAFLARLFDKGPSLVNPLEFPNLVHNAPAGYASINCGASGSNVATCQEEIAGDEAVRVMAEQIACGRLKRAVACGADLDSKLVRAGYARVDRLFGTDSQLVGVLGAVHLEPLTAATRGRAWARVLATQSAGRSGGVSAAMNRALAEAKLESVDCWCMGATEQLTRRHEARAANLLAVAQSERLELRALIGDAGGAGAACIAVAAAFIAAGRAQTVLVTSVTRTGLAHATILGPVG